LVYNYITDSIQKGDNVLPRPKKELQIPEKFPDFDKVKFGERFGNLLKEHGYDENKNFTDEKVCPHSCRYSALACGSHNYRYGGLESVL
jgi:hypothetical protein